MMPPMEGPAATRSETARQDSARIDALVTLLGDDDPRVGETIAQHLKEIGAAAVPALEGAAGSSNPLLGARARTLLGDLKRDATLAAIAVFGRHEAVALEEGLLLISRLHAPEFDARACSGQLDRMAEDLMLRLDPGDGVDALVAGLARYVHQDQGFAANTDDYYDPSNSYLHTLLETRRGIPISLSCLYLLLAERLNLRFYGVGMPGHFLVRYDDGHDTRIVDPYGRGRVLDREGCASLLRGLGLSYDERYLEPVTSRYILERTLKNLIAIYANQERTEALNLHQAALDALRGGA
jgi:regulator of sirC expression with transglutaminase-like and TPR domain